MEPRLNTVLDTGVLKSVVTVKLVRHCQQWRISNTTKWQGGVLSRRGSLYWVLPSVLWHCWLGHL